MEAKTEPLAVGSWVEYRDTLSPPTREAWTKQYGPGPFKVVDANYYTSQSAEHGLGWCYKVEYNPNGGTDQSSRKVIEISEIYLRPTIVLQSNEVERIRKEFEAALASSKNEGRLYIAPPSAELLPLTRFSAQKWKRSLLSEVFGI